MEYRHVRIPPYNSAKGHLICDRTIATGRWKQKFVAGTWYKVSKEVAELLRPQRMKPGDDFSKPAFQICTEEEARQVVYLENNAHLQKTVQPGRAAAAPADIPDLVVEEDEGLNATPAAHELQQRPMRQEIDRRLGESNGLPEDKLEAELAAMPAPAPQGADEAPMELPPIGDHSAATAAPPAAPKADLSAMSMAELQRMADDNGVNRNGLRSKAKVRQALEDAGVA